jgi:hypothetical protein
MTVLEPDVLQKTYRLLIGWDEDRPLPFVDERSDFSCVDPTVVIVANPSRLTCEELSRRGYVNQRHLALLPSRRNLRWLLPHVAKRRGIDDLQLYTPHGYVGRIVKALVVQARATGWQGWVRDTVVIASRQPLPIENMLSEITGERELALSLSPGISGAFQKLTVQVMRPDGSILGYMKMPMTKAADARLRNEAAVVQDLCSYPELRAHIPQLLFAGSLNGRHIVFQSAVDGKAGPTRYARPHEQFLQRLHACRPQRKPGLRLVEETGREWNRVAARMGSNWQSLGQEALKIAARELEGQEVACGIAHGDFAPWNIRISGADLRIFDWECASSNVPLVWDAFHFMTQTECLLSVRHDEASAADGRKKNRSLYLLYLLNSAGQYWEEAAQDVVIRYREQQLLRFMSVDGRAA